MNLATFVTYLGLLITAYSATQEYNRLKLKLSSKFWKFIFLFSLFLMFISTLDWLKIELIQRSYIQILFNNFFWEAKYQAILLLNLFSLYKMYTSTKLRTNNSQRFYELLYELSIEKKQSLFNKLIKENLEYIFKYQKYKNFYKRLHYKLYYLIDSYQSYTDRINNEMEKIVNKQKEYLDNGGNVTQLNDIRKLPNIEYTKLESVRKKIANLIQLKNEDYFFEIFKISILNKNNVKEYAKKDENFGLEILNKIVKYHYFHETFSYVEIFLTKTLSNKNSITFSSLYNKNENVKFIFDNQGYEDGFDLGIIICNTIDNLISNNHSMLTKNIIDNSNNITYQHIKKLYYILEQLDGNRTHLMAEPLYIQRSLLNYIDVSQREEDIAYNLLLTQCSSIEYLALKTKEDYNIKLLENLLSELFNIDSLNKSKFFDIGLIYLDYIFIKNFKDLKRTIDQRINDFKTYIVSSNNLEIIELFIKIFNKSRRNNGKDYISYVKQDKVLKNHWNDINEFLTNLRLKHEA